MHRYHTLGKIPKKRHTIFRSESGNLYYEELKGNKGFTGPSSLLYHIHRPTSIVATNLLREERLVEDPDKRLRMRHFRTKEIERGGGPCLGRTPLLFNGDLTLSMAKPDREEETLYRNAEADELYYVVEGSGRLLSAFGLQHYREGDYIVIPRGIIYKLSFDSSRQTLLIVEGKGEIATPKRYRNEFGQIVERSPYSERDFRLPSELITVDEKRETPITVKQRGAYSEVILDHHPFDLVGWDGYYYPYLFNIEDFEPIVGRVHEPPPVHQTFECKNFVICSFCPRPYDFDKEAIPAPYHHSNVMSDEVIFYASKGFMSRKNVEHGSITLHPDGLTHGPHPGKVEESIGKKGTDELAVMLDSFHPLLVAKEALAIEDGSYSASWLESS